MRGVMLMMKMMKIPLPRHSRGRLRTLQTPDPALPQHLILAVHRQGVDLVRPIQVSHRIRVNRIQNQTRTQRQVQIHPIRPGVALRMKEKNRRK